MGPGPTFPDRQLDEQPPEPIQSISAVTLLTADMAKAVSFYESIGFVKLYGGGDAAFTSFKAGSGYLNLQHAPRASTREGIWGRVIFWVSDVDGLYGQVVRAGGHPDGPPSDAPWGERYFHVRDPDGHELSFARPLV